ncbi:hypothetical protein Mal15_19640 [Stieleria maiorica]|uniref:Uncharacterized protein n=1 Tax=Stieleria maiorica TaxID=2795974 RepID=A0A5B9M9X4_9BACT|nr:DUF6528 family protein [Stieleria maiorica]QEF97918.1 hypothetical protein Mal15_19640 [Stieleria maiorica]
MVSSETSESPITVAVSRSLCLLIVASCLTLGRPVLAKDRLICCGGAEVFILEIDPDQSEAPAPVWSWKAEDSPEIPEAGRRSFATTDECKPIGGSLLITSSSGGVALIRRSDKRCQFYTEAKNAHSACLLPVDRVAVASSFGGDELLVYKLARPSGSPAKPVARIPLRGAHGAIWDEELKRLWALGSDELLLLDIGDEPTSSTIGVDRRIELPTPGGHDLSQSRETSIFFVTTNEHVYRFDARDARFTPHPILADRPKVKSVSEHPQTGEVVYHQGTPENWWSDRIRFLGDREDIQLPGRRLYKVRWDR